MGILRTRSLHLFLLPLLASSSTARANGGFESDFIGWATGGYHASGWYGTERVRVRAVKALFYTPELLVPDGFSRLRNEVWEFFVDFTVRPPARRFDRLWYGVGLELYDRRIRDDSTDETAEYQALELALRAGYIWHPFKAGFYVNPWVGLNLRVDGDASVRVGDSTYSAPRLTPLASLKVGWEL
jgi:hypothetical protein